VKRPRHPPHLPVTYYAHNNAAHDDRACYRGVTVVACLNHSHGNAVTNQGLVSPVGAMPCRESAVGDSIEADFLPARPKQRDGAYEAECASPCLAGQVARREHIRSSAGCAVCCRLMARPSKIGRRKRERDLYLPFQYQVSGAFRTFPQHRLHLACIRDVWQLRHVERAGRGIGRTKRCAQTGVAPSPNKQSLLGDAGE
jgi:hypothetical protein